MTRLGNAPLGFWAGCGDGQPESQQIFLSVQQSGLAHLGFPHCSTQEASGFSSDPSLSTLPSFLIQCSGLVVLSSRLHLVSTSSSLCHQMAMIPRVTLKEESHPVSPRKRRSTSCLHSGRTQKPIFMDILMEHSPTPAVKPIKKIVPQTLSYLWDGSVSG